MFSLLSVYIFSLKIYDRELIICLQNNKDNVVSWDRNLLYKLTMTCCMVGLRTGFHLFNTSFSFSLHFLSKTLAMKELKRGYGQIF